MSGVRPRRNGSVHSGPCGQPRRSEREPDGRHACSSRLRAQMAVGASSSSVEPRIGQPSGTAKPPRSARFAGKREKWGKADRRAGEGEARGGRARRGRGPNRKRKRRSRQKRGSRAQTVIIGDRATMPRLAATSSSSSSERRALPTRRVLPVPSGPLPHVRAPSARRGVPPQWGSCP